MIADGSVDLSSSKRSETGSTRSFSSSIDEVSSKRASFSLRKDAIKLEIKESLNDSTMGRLPSSRAPDGMTVNKLRFDSMGLHGRDKEISVLKNCLSKLNKAEGEEPEKQLVLIGGVSGTGKTALASSLKDPVRTAGGVYVTGKFDLLCRDEPFVALAAASREICGHILLTKTKDSARFERIRDHLIQELGAETHLLTTVIPEYEEVLQGVGPDAIPSSNCNVAGNLEARNQQLNYCFRSFMRIVSSHFAPLVVHLDDLQWADLASLNVLEVFMRDRENANLMIVGCYRSNEVDDAHPMSKFMRDLQQSSQRDKFAITKLEVGNLDEESANQIIMSLLNIDDDGSRTRSLSAICYKRTLGNAFFLRIFAEMLNDNDLLSFNFGLMQWKWDEQRILEETAATANVVDMVQEKMLRMPAEVGQLLQLAACLGSTFDTKTVGLVMESISKIYETDAVEALLEKAVNEHFLEKCGATSYRFVHDKVQEAATGLAPKDEMSSLQFQVGEILLAKLSKEELDAYLFVVVNLLNQGISAELNEASKKRMVIAEMNLKAAEKAVMVSAFKSAAKYSSAGIDLLSKNDRWTSHYNLTLSLYSIGAEVNSFVGEIGLMELFCNEIISNQTGTASLFDKLRAYNVLINSIANRGRAQEAVDMCLDVMAKLGCQFPKMLLPIRAIVSLKKTQKLSTTAEDIAKLDLMTDPAKIESMKLLDKCCTYSYLTKNIFQMIWSISRMVRWTMRFGINEYSPPAFAIFGVIVGMTAGAKAAAPYAHNALAMLEKLKTKSTFCRTTYPARNGVLNWSTPMQSSLKPLLEGYKIGMQAGDTESAMWACYIGISVASVSGRSLAAIEKDCRVYIPQMEELNRKEHAGLTKLERQAALNLMGQSEHTILLTGDAMDEAEFLEQDNSPELHNAYEAYKCVLCCFFGEYKAGADLAIAKKNKFVQGSPGMVLGIADAFARAVCLYAMARTTKQSKYQREAKRPHMLLKGWLQNGNPNVNHHVSILDAERAALEGKLDEACKLYNQGIMLATRGGFIHDGALASERFADYMLPTDRKEAVYRLDNAIRCYEEWGSKAKVEVLRAQHARLQPKPTEINLGGNDVSETKHVSSTFSLTSL